MIGGTTVGGLSDMAWDPRRHAWASTVDNHTTDPSRIWFWSDPAHAHVVGAPLVLKKPDGTPYDGLTADNESLAVLPDGEYLVGSETEPSIRVFGRDGVQRASLPVPARFVVAPAGQSTANATFEGLTVTDGGNRIIASMEGPLSGDTDATLHRFLTYDKDRHGRWSLAKETAYRTAPGNRVAEVQAYGRDSVLVMEAAFTAETGNTISLYAVPKFSASPDITKVADAGKRPSVRKTLVADLVKCPTLGATAKEFQTNPLMDNYEGMAIVPGGTADTVHVISDDNFGATQITRVLTLSARLP
ncbi:esterase-like activity of phytase family protein [Actinoplanes sp. TBRC 11911]|uniref:esterase-like activity of phytase family protein n=1 Tax=Actinoplanes sp. TBRC 11911 TaxID=2729386 RepID=UPI00145EDE29|nr:esterase-like activity of phytase family protein [Actinoplanes sp. TBRC 11911]NMO50115.1 esterase-like activity of phytase family protein [Actinoplanes sp. TBRC 11911]